MMSETNPESLIPKPKRPSLVVRIMLVLLIIALVSAIYFFLQWKKAQEEVEDVGPNPQVSEEKTSKLIDQVSQVVLLPENETPSVIRVTNIDAIVENREFFKEAQPDDIVLIYGESRKALLFRPSSNKLVNMAPIQVAGTQNYAPGSLASPAGTQ